jgi:hypothetical protein
MTRQSTIALCLIAALATGACSTKPRKFSATVRPSPVVDQLAPASDHSLVFDDCNRMVRAGRKGGFASAAGTGLAGIGSAALTTGTLVFNGAVTSGSAWGPSAAASAAVPVVGIAFAIGVNRLIRSGREKSYRKHMSICLGEFGYEVVDWTRVKKKQSATAMLQVAAPTPSAQQDLTPETPELANADPVSPISD